MRKLKNWIVSSAKNLWGLNWEAKIGILFLIPPIIGVIIFRLNYLMQDLTSIISPKLGIVSQILADGSTPLMAMQPPLQFLCTLD